MSSFRAIMTYLHISNKILCLQFVSSKMSVSWSSILDLDHILSQVQTLDQVLDQVQALDQVLILDQILGQVLDQVLDPVLDQVLGQRSWSRN